MAGRNIYVSPSGSNANPGTQALPFQTITAALAVSPNLGAGDKVIVMDGTYNEQVVVSRGGDSTGDFKLVSMNRQGAKLRSPSNVYSTVNIIKSYVTVDGFDVAGSGTGHAIEATFLDGNSNNDGPHHISVINNVCHDVAGGGIELAYGDFYLIDNNVCYGNCATNDYQGSGISVYEPRAIGGSTTTLRIIISRNTCYLNQAYALVGGGAHSDGNGIILDDFRHTQQGGHPPYAYNTLVENNVCYFNGGRGIHVFFSDNALVRNNTCYFNNLDNLNPGTWRGELSNVQCSNNTFVNNIAWANPAANGYNTAVVDGCFSAYVNTNVIWARNISFNGTPGAASLTQSGVVSTFVAAAPYNNLLGVNPLLVTAGVGVASPDLHIQSASPARNTGVATYGLASLDRDGGARVSGGAVDIGAYEIQEIVVPPPTTKPKVKGLPVRVKVTTLRNKCVEADPDFYTEGRKPVAYEFGGGKRVFREVTDQRFPYGDE